MTRRIVMSIHHLRDRQVNLQTGARFTRLYGQLPPEGCDSLPQYGRAQVRRGQGGVIVTAGEGKSVAVVGDDDLQLMVRGADICLYKRGRGVARRIDHRFVDDEIDLLSHGPGERTLVKVHV